MGLDITAYSYLGPRVDYNCECFGDLDDHVRLYVNPDCPRETAGGIITGCYLRTPRTEEFTFWAGSYSGYNRWRDRMSMTALGVPAEKVWAEPSRFQGRPLVELINFSDCEGVIGPAVAEKLALDMVQLGLRGEHGGAWVKAFTMAAMSGAVEFH